MINRLTYLNRASFAAKKIYQIENTHQIIKKTTQTMEKVAAITLGPYGRNVMIQNQMQQPRITKDGVTVVKHIEFENRLENAIATLIKKSVDGTNKYAGDGTTTSTVLIGQIMKQAYKKIMVGQSVRQIRKGLEIGRKIGIQFLESCSRKVNTKQDLIKVAMISTNGKAEIANFVAEAVSQSNAVTVEKSQKTNSFLQFYSGIKITRGLQSQQFVNTSSGKVIYNYPLVVVSNQPLKNVKQVVKSLQLAKKARKQLIFFAPDFSESVKSTLIYNNKKKIVETTCISIPQYGDKGKEMLPKISKMTQAYYFNEFTDKKIGEIDWDDFGKAIKVEIDQYETKIQVKQTQKKDNVSCVIFVGGPNETVMLENYDHIIDALNSVMSAKKDGVVAGGGVSLWRLAQLLQQYEGEGKVGVKILAHALKQPRTKLMQYIPLQNRPLSGNLWQGYDLKQQKIVDMFDAGVIDSVIVAKSTLIDSISLCNVLVQVDIAIARTDLNLSSVSLKELNKKYSL